MIILFALSTLNLVLAISYLSLTAIKQDERKADPIIMGCLFLINHLFDFCASLVFLWIWQHYIGHVEKKLQLQRESTLVGVIGDG